jgi:formylglycine-generating enzyme required for sulfatase activity
MAFPYLLVLLNCLLSRAQLVAPETERPVLKAGTARRNPRDGLTYVWIPPGTFSMGCSPRDTECYPLEKPALEATVSKGFWIGRTEVTVDAYKRFAAAAGRQMPLAPSSNSGWTNGNMPIVNVTWDEAQAYCSWSGGRLPTEPQWEYAARGGNAAARYGPLDEVAWYLSNSGGGTHEVAQKRANGFGLFDTLGNVWEWVGDGQRVNYHFLRGGSWSSKLWVVRVSYRTAVNSGEHFDDSGLRCALDAVGQ